MSEQCSTFISNTLSTSAVRKVGTLPELIALIGHHLPQSDLFSCVQVSRLWNKIFVPLLWKTIDTRSTSWLRIFNEDVPETTRPLEETKEWLRTIFAKYGHFVRHLDAHWHIVLEAAAGSARSNGCTNLESLTVGTVRCYRGIPGPISTQTTHVPATMTTAITTTTITTTTAPGATPPDEYLLPWPEKATKQYSINNFMTLIRLNPKLIRLSFPHLLFMNFLPKEFFINGLLLTCLNALQDLDLTYTILDAREVLKAMPRLERLHIYVLSGVHSFLPQEKFPNLVMLGIRVPVDVKAIFKLLPHLPGLKEFRVRRLGILDTALTPEDLEDIAAAAESAIVTATSISGQQDMPVTIFQVDTFPEIDDKIMALFVGVFRRLKRIRVPRMFPETQRALWERCFLLEEIEISNLRDIEDWRVRRRVQQSGVSGEKEF
ncbi:hypothetical protein BGW39_011805 [Mortierella sp. 14UC]|nr:hypothetical protein BGW39_011805 [Mortierella sp. 14UC]